MPDRPMILVVEDEEQILRVLRPTLEAQGYGVVHVATGGEAAAAMDQQRFSALIVDLGLPDMDGKDVIAEARRRNAGPIIVLSARDSETEKIAALDAGAEDYVSKPFSVGELLARLRVLLRSTRAPIDIQTWSMDGLELDFRRRTAALPSGEVKLSARETAFLRLLAERNGDVVSHREIILAVWGDPERADAQFVRVLAGQVRQKIEPDPASPSLVITVPGLGYQLGPTRR
jgi:two-component system, OmpR family, KDP operon response regulator KdpE